MERCRAASRGRQSRAGLLYGDARRRNAAKSRHQRWVRRATDEYGGHVTFYIAVEDVAATLDAVEKLGGSRMMGPSQVPNGPVIGLFKDPQGHTIGLAQM